MKKVLVVLSIMLLVVLSVANCGDPKCPLDGTSGIYQRDDCGSFGCHSVYQCCYGHHFYCEDGPQSPHEGMNIGKLDNSIPGSLNLDGRIAQQQDIASQDIANQARQQQMAQSASLFNLSTAQTKQQSKLYYAYNQALSIKAALKALYDYHPELRNKDNLTAEKITSIQIEAYGLFYDVVNKNGLGDNVDKPDRFKLYPQIAMQKAEQLGEEAEGRLLLIRERLTGLKTQ